MTRLLIIYLTREFLQRSAESGQTMFQIGQTFAPAFFCRRTAEFERLAEESRQKQKAVEDADTGTSEDFLGKYYAQYVFCHKDL